MGAFLTRMVICCTGRRDIRVLMLGLDNAGKTTILYRLKLGQPVTTIPTVGFNVESITFNNDVGGQDKIRPLWRHYFTGTQALIFVVDVTDSERLDEARVELLRVLSSRDLKYCALLVFANKQDLPNGKLLLYNLELNWCIAMNMGQVRVGLQLDRMSYLDWKIVPSCATTGTGLDEGLHWIAQKHRTR